MQGDRATAEGPERWATYQLPFFSIDYPSGWQIKASDDGTYVAIYPPELDPYERNKIEIAYLGAEIREDQDLRTWSDMYYRVFHGSDPRRVDVVDFQSSPQEDEKGIGRKLYEAILNEWGISQDVLLTHGRLVLSISTYTDDVHTKRILLRIADSLKFASNAPRTLGELYQTDQLPPSLEETLAEIQRGGEVSQNIITRDGEASKALPSLPPAEPSPEFLEQERIYRERLEEYGLPQIGDGGTQSQDAMSDAALLGVVPSDRKALPSDWWSPLSTAGSINANCDSQLHTGRAAMAIDVGVPEGTQVFTAQAGTIVVAGWDRSGYGYLMRIATDNVNVADENRKYWHNYAHLQSFRKTSGTVTRGEWIANSGNTGTSYGPHLHFHVTLDVNKDDITQIPVDLSPLVGFRPNLSYPTSGTCGQIVAHASDPIIIEPVVFAARHQRDGHYWFCYTTLNRTTECYMEGVPNNGAGWDPLNTSVAPELDYANAWVPQSGTYYLWVCGRGGSYNDDSLHMGYGGAAPTSSQRMTGYHQNAWVWQSVRMDLGRPYLNLPSGQVTVNIWMREDGMRIDRVLLTRDVNYNPTNNIRCGGY